MHTILEQLRRCPRRIGHWFNHTATLGFAAITKWLVAAIGVCTFCVATAFGEPVPSRVDTALVISIDVSSSVNERRYRLQLEGIAAALEDPEVLRSVLNGPSGNIMVSVVAWADNARLAVPWTLIKSKEDAGILANKIRAITQQDGEFTCLGRMMRYVADKVVVRLPTRALKTIVDVSGDGPENCNSEGMLKLSRSDLIATGVTINGLPILEGRTAKDLDKWYLENVIGGSSSFIMPAAGYADFARAFRQKFVIELSWLDPVRQIVGAPAARGPVVRPKQD